MNELQMKLARRRNLNGEGSNGGSSNSAPSSAPIPIPTASNIESVEGNRSRKNSEEFTASSSIERPLSFRRTISRDVPSIPSSSPSGSSGLNELQMKLQRRKQLNGEEGKVSTALPPSIAAPDSSIPTTTSKSLDSPKVVVGGIPTESTTAVGSQKVDNSQSLVQDTITTDTVEVEPEPQSTIMTESTPSGVIPIPSLQANESIDEIELPPATIPEPESVPIELKPEVEAEAQTEPLLDSKIEIGSEQESTLVAELELVEESVSGQIEQLPLIEKETCASQPIALAEEVQSVQLEENQAIIESNTVEVKEIVLPVTTEQTSVEIIAESNIIVVEEETQLIESHNVPTDELADEMVMMESNVSNSGEEVVVFDQVEESTVLVIEHIDTVDQGLLVADQSTDATSISSAVEDTPPVDMESENNSQIKNAEATHDNSKMLSGTIPKPAPVDTMDDPLADEPTKNQPALKESPSTSNTSSPRSSSSKRNPSNNKGWYPGKYILERRARWGSGKDKFLMNSEDAQSHYKDFLGGSDSESRRSVTSLSVSTKLLMDHAASNLNNEDTEYSNEEMKQLLEDLKERQAVINSIEEEIFKSAQVTVGDKSETNGNSNNDDDFMKEVMEEIGPLSTSASTASSKSAASKLKLAPITQTSPKPTMSKARSKRFGLFSSSYQDGNDQESEGLFEDSEDLTPPPSQKNRPLINKAKDYFSSLTSAILLDEKDSPSEKNGGLDLLLDGSQPLSRSTIGGLSEADLLRSHVATRRSNLNPSKQTVDELLKDRGFLPDNNAEKDNKLFTSQDDQENESQPAKLANDPSAENDDEMDYQEFLFKFTKCPELVNDTRRFILSIIGPLGDGNPPAKGKKVDYIFYGNHRMDERCKQFFDDMQAKFVSYAAFQGESQESIISARDCLEQYVMQRIGDIGFQFVETPDDDDQLLRRMKLLSFLTPEVLDIKAELFSEGLLNLAGDELRKINTYKTPGEKIACVVKCVTIIFRSLSLCRVKQEIDKDSKSKDAGSAAEEGSGMQLAGADDFLPLFIWVVLRSHIPRLCSNCEYIQAYLNPHRLMSKSGYCLINLRSAMEFVTYIEPSSINIDPEYFEQQLAAAEQKLQELEDQQS